MSKEIKISEETKEEIAKFFMKTSVPRILKKLEEEKQENKQSS